MPLTATEYRILELLLRRMPAVVDRKAIAEHAWADETDPLGSNAIDVQLSRLRAKLPDAGVRDRHGPRRRATGWSRSDHGASPGVRRQSIRVALAATVVVGVVYLVIGVGRGRVRHASP